MRFQQRWIEEWVLSSGATFDSYWGLLVELSEGQVVRERFFFDRDRALEALRAGE